MGTTVSSLQMLGTTEEAVKTALPKAIVGKWSERFITACPGELAFSQLEKKAGSVSKKLDCTVLSVSLFDSDMLSLVLYVSGKRTARHVVDPEMGECVLGNVNAFCAGLGLKPQIAPLLKRLFTASDQEEKLQILAAVLGAPLFARWDDPFEPTAIQLSDEGPLHSWVMAHPLPPKIKNQACMEIVQEIGERMPSDAAALILRPLAYADEEDEKIFGHTIGTVVGNYCSGGEWARWDENGLLQLTPLMEDGLENLSYAEADGRLLTLTSPLVQDPPGCYSKGASTIVSDSAGLLPLPIPLTPDGELTVVNRCYLLPNGGFLALFQPQYDMGRQIREASLRCYGADGACLWERTGPVNNVKLHGDKLYLNAVGEDGPMLHCLTLEGQLLHSAVSSCEGPLLVSGAYLYQLERTGYRKDDVLHRFTPELQDAGCVQVPYLSDVDISPDGTLLFCAGYSSGLVVIDLDEFRPRREARSPDNFTGPIVDGKNRLWVHNGSYFECYSPNLELMSRHRLAGNILDHTLNQAGEVCLVTYQRNKYLTRVYRFY